LKYFSIKYIFNEIVLGNAFLTLDICSVIHFTAIDLSRAMGYGKPKITHYSKPLHSCLLIFLLCYLITLLVMFQICLSQAWS